MSDDLGLDDVPLPSLEKSVKVKASAAKRKREKKSSSDGDDSDEPKPKRAKAKAKAAPKARARPKSKAAADKLNNDPEHIAQLLHEIDVETKFGRELCKKSTLKQLQDALLLVTDPDVQKFSALTTAIECSQGSNAQQKSSRSYHQFLQGQRYPQPLDDDERRINGSSCRCTYAIRACSGLYQINSRREQFGPYSGAADVPDQVKARCRELAIAGHQVSPEESALRAQLEPALQKLRAELAARQADILAHIPTAQQTPAQQYICDTQAP